MDAKPVVPHLKYAIAVLLALSLGEAQAEDYFYVNIFAGKIDGTWDDRGEMSTGIRGGWAKRIGGDTWVMAEVGHTSQLMVGPPFDDEKESWITKATIGLEWRFGR